jgi:hypothetical protein
MPPRIHTNIFQITIGMFDSGVSVRSGMDKTNTCFPRRFVGHVVFDAVSKTLHGNHWVVHRRCVCLQGGVVTDTSYWNQVLAHSWYLTVPGKLF